MQSVSALFNTIISGEYTVEYKLTVNGVTYNQSDLYSISTEHNLFESDVPMVGCTVSGQIDVRMKKPSVNIPRMAELKPYARVTNGTQTSEWVQQGVFYIDTRSVSHNGSGLDILELHGFDVMLKTEANYPSDNASNYPALDTYVVNKIASAIGVTVDSRTTAIMTAGYRISLPVSYSMREVLGYIGSMYAGNWIITETGKLRLISLNSIGKETNYLIDNAGFVITFGGDRILV